MKLTKVTLTRLYELTYLVAAVFTDSELAKIREEIEALVKKYSGTVKKFEDWGKKNLAYKIKKAGKTSTEAFYSHYQIEFPADKVQEFEKFLYMNPQIIRHLLVVAQDDEQKTQVETKEEVSE